FGIHFFQSSYKRKIRFINNDKVILEYRIHIISSESNDPLDLSKFSSPIETSNVTLLIGEKKLHVSKEYLAIHSPFFLAMFSGNFLPRMD
ncbi:hypothetical protein PENTCL1PPCAC_26107, partial [Pristionchus entomophagus]